MRRAGVGLAWWLTAGLALAQAPASARLDTLLYSRAERQALVQGRTAASGTENATQVQLNGIVKRSRGNSTVWINQRAVPEGQSLAPTQRTRIGEHSVTLDARRVRVGETLDLQSGARTDVLPKGALAVKAAP